MIQSYQETDSREIMVLPKNLKFSTLEVLDETIGGELLTQYFQIPDDASLIKRAWNITRRTENSDVVREARKLLSIIKDMMAIFPQMGLDLIYLPRLNAFNLDDGSVLIEWKFNDFRIGFGVEPNIKESGWYLVSNKNLGEISASGYISIKDVRGLIAWLFNFVFLIFNSPEHSPISLPITFQGSM